MLSCIQIIAVSITIATAATKPWKPKVVPQSHVPPPSPPVPVQTQSQSQSHYEQGSDAKADILKSDSDVAADGYAFR